MGAAHIEFPRGTVPSLSQEGHDGTAHAACTADVNNLRYARMFTKADANPALGHTVLKAPLKRGPRSHCAVGSQDRRDNPQPSPARWAHTRATTTSEAETIVFAGSRAFQRNCVKVNSDFVELGESTVRFSPSLPSLSFSRGLRMWSRGWSTR